MKRKTTPRIHEIKLSRKARQAIRKAIAQNELPYNTPTEVLYELVDKELLLPVYFPGWIVDPQGNRIKEVPNCSIGFEITSLAYVAIFVEDKPWWRFW